MAELETADQLALEQAYRRLRETALRYEPFVAHHAPEQGEPPIHSLEEMKTAQEDLLAAEEALWELRERLMNWPRPHGALRATQVVEWILEEESPE